jgi:hypothetical protein
MSHLKPDGSCVNMTVVSRVCFESDVCLSAEDWSAQPATEDWSAAPTAQAPEWGGATADWS